MKSISKQIESSTCFGVAYDGAVKECKICEIKQECKAKSEGENVTKPAAPVKKEVLEKTTKVEVEPAEKPVAKKETPAKPPKATTSAPAAAKKSGGDVDSIDFKNMSMDDLESMAAERGADDGWKKYDNVGIRRMRCTMAIKKTF